MKRQEFTKKVATGTMATGIAPTILLGKSGWKSANDRINLDVTGIRGMGQSHIKAYTPLENVEVAAILDIDQNLLLYLI